MCTPDPRAQRPASKGRGWCSHLEANRVLGGGGGRVSDTTVEPYVGRPVPRGREGFVQGHLGGAKTRIPASLLTSLPTAPRL